MKRILICLAIASNLFSAEQNPVIYVFQEHISNILCQSKTVDELNNKIVAFELSGDKRIKQIINANSLKIIYFYLQNKFPDQFTLQNFEEDILKKGPLYYKYLEPIIFITKNLKLNALNKLLIVSGIDINIKLKELYGKYDIISIINDIQNNNMLLYNKLEFLLKIGLVNFQNNIGRTGIITEYNLVWHTDLDIIRLRDINIVKLLIESGANINKQDNLGNTALTSLFLLKRENYDEIDDIIDMARLLINNGADIDIKNRDGKTAIMLASCNGACIKLVELLIPNTKVGFGGANINLKDNHGNTALMLASSEIRPPLDMGSSTGNYELDKKYSKPTGRCIYEVKLLIEAGSDINLKNDCGNTALILASLNGLIDVVRLLIGMGADINIKNNDNKTALMLVSDIVNKIGNVVTPSSINYKEIVKLLKSQDTCIIQ